jgi:hypothetical protein
MDGDPEIEEFATKLFGLARAGDTEALRAYVEAGVPVDLTNGKGDTLLMLAAYYGHAGADAARRRGLQEGVWRGQSVAGRRGRPVRGAAVRDGDRANVRK